MDLRERVGLVAHVGELRLVVRVGLHVRGEHGLPAVVAVARPVEDLQAARLRAQPVLRGPRRRQRASKQARPSGRSRDLQELLPAQPPLECLVHSAPPHLPLVAGWADDPHHFRELLAGVRGAMRGRASVIDAITALQLEELAAELELDASGDDDEELLGVAVGVGLLSGGASDLQLTREDLQVMKRLRGQ